MDRFAEAEATGDVKAVMETKGVGKSQGYDLTKETRKDKKADQKQQALEWYADGVLPEEISNRFCGKPTERTIWRWLGKQDF